MDRWRMETNLEQAKIYFQQDGFFRLFQGLQERYTSLSHLGGKISIEVLTEEEASTLEGFLKIHCKENMNVTISVAQIRKCLKSTRFGEVVLEELVPEVMGQSLISRKEEKEQFEAERKEFFDNLVDRFLGTQAGDWLSFVVQANNITLNALYQDYKQNRSWLEVDFPKVLDGINNLPVDQGKIQLINIFASQITGDPHFFDDNNRAGYYLIRGLLETRGYHLTFGHKAEAKTEILYAAGIIRDDLSNHILSYGIQGYERNGRLHKGMECYHNNQEPLLLTLRNLSILESAGTESNQVYIMENPAVFAYLVHKNPDGMSCICSSGQPNLSLIVLLDLLRKRGTTLYYAGDFDPEGLRIAQRLKNRYGDGLTLWKYTKEHYLKAKSNVTISERRLKQLDALSSEELCLIADCIREYGVAGYQENMLSKYL